MVAVAMAGAMSASGGGAGAMTDSGVGAVASRDRVRDLCGAAEGAAHEAYLEHGEGHLDVGTRDREQLVDRRLRRVAQQAATGDRRRRLGGVHVDSVDRSERHRADGVQHGGGQPAHRREQGLAAPL